METGTVSDKGRSGRTRIFEDNIDRVRQFFGRSPRTSIRTAARRLEISRSAVQKVL